MGLIHLLNEDNAHECDLDRRQFLFGATSLAFATLIPGCISQETKSDDKVLLEEILGKTKYRLEVKSDGEDRQVEEHYGDMMRYDGRRLVLSADGKERWSKDLPFTDEPYEAKLFWDEGEKGNKYVHFLVKGMRLCVECSTDGSVVKHFYGRVYNDHIDLNGDFTSRSDSGETRLSTPTGRGGYKHNVFDSAFLDVIKIKDKFYAVEVLPNRTEPKRSSSSGPDFEETVANPIVNFYVLQRYDYQSTDGGNGLRELIKLQALPSGFESEREGNVPPLGYIIGIPGSKGWLLDVWNGTGGFNLQPVNNGPITIDEYGEESYQRNLSQHAVFRRVKSVKHLGNKKQKFNFNQKDLNPNRKDMPVSISGEFSDVVEVVYEWESFPFGTPATLENVSEGKGELHTISVEYGSGRILSDGPESPFRSDKKKFYIISASRE